MEPKPPPPVGEDPTALLLETLREEVRDLRAQLQRCTNFLQTANHMAALVLALRTIVAEFSPFWVTPPHVGEIGARMRAMMCAQELLEVIDRTNGQ